jgi:hypothetical protein
MRFDSTGHVWYMHTQQVMYLQKGDRDYLLGTESMNN